MNDSHSPKESAPKPRLSLEAKVRRLVRYYRAAQRRRQRRKARSDRARRQPLSAYLMAALVVNLFPFALVAATTSLTPSFEQALQAAAVGHYDSAVQTYSQILAARGDSASVLYNLGNAFYHQGRWGSAILNYERALWLSPHDPDVAANLRLAQHQAGLSPAGPAGWERVGRLVNVNSAAWIGSAALLVFALALVFRQWTQPAARSWVRAVTVCSFAVVLLTSADLGYWWTRLDRAVILSADVPAHVAPAAAADVSFELREGQIVDVGKSHGTYVLVRVADGQSGWISRNLVARIVSEQVAGKRGQQA